MHGLRYSAKAKAAFSTSSATWIIVFFATIAIAICCTVASLNNSAQTAYADEGATQLVVAEAYEIDAADDTYSGDYYYDDYFFWPLYFDYSLSEPVGIQQGKHFKLKPYLMEKEGKKLVWSSSKTNIATVNSKGVVTAKKPGKTKITVKNRDDSSDYAKVTIEVYKKPVKSKVYKKIMKLKSTYREGKKWGNNKTYYWAKANMYCYACIALAGRISDKVFGKSAPLKVHRNYNKIKIGDHIRIGGAHSVIVLTKNKKSITVVEGNYNGRIHWGRTIKRSELKSSGFEVWTRY